MKSGKFIVLEGLDGAGTTTQCQRMATLLRNDGYEVVVTNEPSSGPVGVMIRQALTHRLGLPGGPLTPETLALLFAADRVDHVAAEIAPAVKRGAIVLSDRYLLSSLAYQGAQLPMAWVQTVNDRAVTPDLTLFLSVPLSVAATRRKVRGKAEELYEHDEAQRRTAKQYGAAIRLRRKKGERIALLNGAQPIEQVTLEAIKHVRTLLQKGAKR